jgi:hypothetical protein
MGFKFLVVGKVNSFCCALVEGKLHDINVVENVGGIDSNFFNLIISNIVGNLLNLENMYFELGNVVTIEVVQLVFIKTQITLWKPHHCNSICWGFFFVVSDNLLINIVNA